MKLRFSEFTLDVDSRQLLRGVREIHLTPKAFELLKTLAESGHKALSKAELHEQLWPGIFVAEANLASLVAEIREALKDDARSPQFVRTVHGYGYAFCGEVTAVQAPPAPSKNAAPGYWLIGAGREVPLEIGENIIGRDPDVRMCLSSPSVSRRHARITVEGAGATLEDLGSKNGTSLRGERLSGPVRLADGDELRVGSFVLTFRVLHGETSTETATL